MTVSHISLTRAVKKILTFSPLENSSLRLKVPKQCLHFYLSLRGITKFLKIHNEGLKKKRKNFIFLSLAILNYCRTRLNYGCISEFDCIIISKISLWEMRYSEAWKRKKEGNNDVSAAEHVLWYCSKFFS